MRFNYEILEKRTLFLVLGVFLLMPWHFNSAMAQTADLQVEPAQAQ